MQLRPYQERLIRDLRVKIREGHRKVLVVLPTGGGKTVVASFIARGCASRRQSMWFICHRDFLVTQTHLTFMQNDLDASIIAAGIRPQYHRQLQVCMIDTLKGRLDKLDPPDVMVWDEAHHLRAAGWEKVSAFAPDALQIGLTATPERLDGKGLSPPFTAMVEGPTTAELMELGALSDYVAYAPGSPDLSGVGKVAGDFNQHQLTEAVERGVIVGDLIGSYRQYANGLRAVYFCPSISYSERLARAFTEAGIPAQHLDGESDTAQRKAAARRFADGELQVLTNVGLFGEGYDLAAQAGRDVTIECVGLVRPTDSLTLHRQQIGRCLRPKDRKAVILDHAGNLKRLGLPDGEIVWNLHGSTSRKKEVKDYKECPVCKAINKLSAVVCVECESPFLVKPRQIEEKDGEIQEIDREKMLEAARLKAKWTRERLAKCQTFEDFRRLGIELGYKPGWAGLQYRATKDKVEAQARAHLRDYK